MKKTYQEQQRLTGTAWVMTASASIAEIKGQLRKYVTSETTAKKVVGNLYIAAEKDNQIVYRQGNSLATAFTALLTLSDNNGSVTGRLTIEQWMENNGVSTGTETMQTLIARVKDAFEAADPKTSIKELAK
ncbi:MAG: hypothetical protein LBR98_08085 [Syntrophomonadaceae bacterium]|nr:hypothetical protein [Syntrophomonadaceae bacterium]